MPRRMRVPFPPDREWLAQRLQRLIDANCNPLNATLRVAVIRNRGGMFEGPGPMREFDVVAFTADVNRWGDSVKLGLVPNAPIRRQRIRWHQESFLVGESHLVRTRA